MQKTNASPHRYHNRIGRLRRNRIEALEWLAAEWFFNPEQIAEDTEQTVEDCKLQIKERGMI